MVNNMGNRKQEILKAIIREHILSASPIGSRTLAKKYDLGVSSATIRNEMADLEELGYLEQPHTSAGRIPSDKGYRYYVDTLMEKDSVEPAQLKQAVSDFYNEKKGVQGIISGMANMLSRFTRYAAMASEPQLEKSRIRKIQLIQVTENSLLIVLITDTGIVNNKIVKLEQGLTSRQIRYINNYLVNRLKNRELTSIDQQVMQSLEQELMSRINLSQELLTLLYQELQTIARPADFKIYLGGTSYILEQPEFNDLKTLKEVLNILDHKDILRQLIEDISDTGVEVKIGEENQLEEMKKCSLVIASYKVGDRAIGKIGVLGPTRMEYPRVISTVDFMSDVLSKIISEVGR